MTHPLDLGRNRLRTLVSGNVETSPRLPLVHSTDTFTFEEILAEQKIRPQNCPVFEGEALTYFFYGRPAFRPNAGVEPTSLAHYFPVCLVFKPSFTIAISRMFPFDSGAFHRGLYEAFIHKKMKLGDFGLDIDESTPGKVISLFFGSVTDYLLGSPTVTPAIDAAQFEAQSLTAIINARSSNHLDGRCASVEMQTAQDISIVDAVSAVALPSTFVDGETGRKLAALGIEMLPYRAFGRTKPDDYPTMIANLCIDYYIKINLIVKG